MSRSARMAAAATLLCLLVVAPGCTPGDSRAPGSDEPEGVAARLVRGLSRREASGRILFNHYCTICHGEGARGDGFNSYTLQVRPADLMSQLESEGAGWLTETIAMGSKARGQSNLCPPWGPTLNKAQIEEIVLYLDALHRDKDQAGAIEEGTTEEGDSSTDETGAEEQTSEGD